MASDEVDPDLKNQENALEASYIYVKVLGRGAFGEANLYRKAEDKSLVVWKEVNLAKLSDKERRDALSEVDILSLLNHANIITYYNHFLDGETLLIEMEYANNGSLYHKIAQQEAMVPEEIIKWYLYQLVSALSHIHSYDIIHRDIKTLNIFMTNNDLIKLGDFGISRVLESESEMAESVVGTPYYMSPEIIQGQKYNYKTDIWSLGCVLYELMTLKRVFQATNQLRLAYEIVKGDYEALPSQYSEEIRDLVKMTLQKQSIDRPSADDILSSPIFTKDNSNDEMKKKVWELNTHSRRLRLQSSYSTETVPIIKSKTSEVYQWGGGKFTPVKQDLFTKSKSAVQVAVGYAHFAVVTMEKELYTWANVQGGAEIVGQLGQGNKSAYKAPQKIDSPGGGGFIQVSCGEDFTLAVTDVGQVYSCGSDYYGCLGVGNAMGDEVLCLTQLDFFSSKPVEEISCGDNHCVALTKDGDVYTWGCGEFGRLGLNSEDDYISPQKVKTPGKHLVKHVIGGSDGTFLITTTGRVLACGSNEHNKLGLNSEMSGLRKRKQSYDIPCKYTFSTVKPLVRYSIVTIATSNTHSAAIDMYGYLLTFGSNKYGQLGVGDYKKRLTVVKVGGELTGKQVINVACGNGYTVAATSDNEIYSWGNGENGRLGARYEGKGPNNLCTAYPRPVFGSLHDVPNIAARHWHTIIIAEKVLNQKTIRSRISSPSCKHNRQVVLPSPTITEEDSAFSDGSKEISSQEIPNCTKDSGIPPSPEVLTERSIVPKETEESELPEWLKAELEDAEVIPLPINQQIPSNLGRQDPSSVQSSTNQMSVAMSTPIIHPPTKQIIPSSDNSSGQFEVVPDKDHMTMERSSLVVCQLLQRISELEKENKELKELVKTQATKLAECEVKHPSSQKTAETT